MNKHQKAYAATRAYRETLVATLKRAEMDYCAAHGYTTDDGTPAEALWMIEDDAAFEIASTDFWSGHEAEQTALVAAEQAQRAAEDALINWGLSIMPRYFAREREVLRDKAVRDYATRQKLIDLAYRVDCRTIPA